MVRLRCQNSDLHYNGFYKSLPWQTEVLATLDSFGIYGLRHPQTSVMAEMTVFGGAKSGLPMPKLMMGAPRFHVH